MSIDFDSAALQTQHDEDEYDQEDYAREQEVCDWMKFLQSSYQIHVSTVFSNLCLFATHHEHVPHAGDSGQSRVWT